MDSERVIININTDNCVQCGKCARVCPATVLCQESKGGRIDVKNIEGCIMCGHCVDVCPTDSVQHSLFPPEKVHSIDYSALPTPEQVMLLIKSRRSNRTITSKPIPEQQLRQIVEAAHYAPTASNNRQVSITVITDPELLRGVSEMTIRTFDSVIRKLNFSVVRWLLKPFLRDVYDQIPAFYRYKQLHQNGEDPILRKATALLVFHTPKSSELGCQDANLAYQNASLMAQSFGISQVYMGFVMRAIRQGHRKAFSRMFRVDGTIHAIMALGIPAFRYAKYTERGI